MVLELGIALWSFVEEFFQYLLSDLSSIPFTISFGAAILLTFMYLANFVSDILLRSTLVPIWIFAIITYFFPTLIPKEHEFASLAIFAVMIVVAVIAVKQLHRTRNRIRTYGVASDVLAWMKSAQLLSPNRQIREEDMKKKIVEILKRNNIT